MHSHATTPNEYTSALLLMASPLRASGAIHANVPCAVTRELLDSRMVDSPKSPI
jgi:hypothetical protein